MQQGQHDNSVGVATDPPAATTGLLLVHILLRRWVWMLLVVVLAFITAVTYLRCVTPYYAGSARLYVEPDSPAVLDDQAKNTRPKNYLYTQASVLTSAAVMEQVIRQARQAPADSPLHRMAETWDVADLQHGLTATVGKRDEIITVTYLSPDPHIAAALANAVVDAYLSYQAGGHRDTSDRLLEILRHEKAQRDAERQAKFDALAQFRRDNPDMIFDSTHGNVMAENAARLAEALTRAQLDTLEAQAAYDSLQTILSQPFLLQQFIQAQRASTLSPVAADARTLLETKLDDLRIRRQNLLRVVTPDHPSARAIQDQIADLVTQIDDMDRRYAESQLALAEQKLQIARQKEQQIRARYDAQRAEARTANEKLNRYALLKAEYEQAAHMCELLDERIRRLDATEDAGALDIRVLERARVATTPAAPNTKRVLAIAMASGLALGCGLAFVVDLFDPRFRDQHELVATVSRFAPVLLTLPAIKRRGRTDRAAAVILHEPKGPISRQFQKVCASLTLHRNDQAPRLVIVTAPSPGQGVTTITSNLAIAMARAGRRTLLVDANFHRPRLGRWLGMDDVPGLTEVVLKQAALPQAIVATHIDGLDFLGGGRACVEPVELCHHRRFRNVLGIVACRYDHVILDAAALTEGSEALALAAVADAVLLTLPSKGLRRDLLARSLEELGTTSAPLLGFVLNAGIRATRHGHWRSRLNRLFNRTADFHVVAAPRRLDNRIHFPDRHPSEMFT